MKAATSFLIACALFIPMAMAEQEVALTESTVLRFASVEEGQAALSARDRFIKALSPFDRQSRLQSERDDLTDKDLTDLASSQVLPWEAEQIEKVSGIVTAVSEKLSGYNIPLPQRVLLIQTSGKEEGNAAYTRENAIVFPKRYVEGNSLERTLIHEIFHVLSSQNADLRKSLYEIIGFRPCEEIELPSSLKPLKITNPDGPNLDNFIELDVDGEQRPAVPVLFAKEKYSGGSFFKYLTFKLMVLERADDQLRPATDGGEPILLDPKSNASFHRQIGANTGYIIHPDEVLASNFELLILNSKKVKTPRILAEMKRVLQP